MINREISLAEGKKNTFAEYPQVKTQRAETHSPWKGPPFSLPRLNWLLALIAEGSICAGQLCGGWEGHGGEGEWAPAPPQVQGLPACLCLLQHKPDCATGKKSTDISATNRNLHRLLGGRG